MSGKTHPVAKQTLADGVVVCYVEMAGKTYYLDDSTGEGIAECFTEPKIINGAYFDDLNNEQKPEYAKLSWHAEDVQSVRKGWTLEQCEKWLEENGKHLRDRLTEFGFEVIQDLLPPQA